MEFVTIIIIAVSLAMDAFAVSVAAATSHKQMPLARAIRMAAFFGVFQAVMPLIGYIGAVSLEKYITNFDHWIAFGLLFVIGAKMIWEALHQKTDEKQPDPTSIAILFVLAIATSIDALAVGITLPLFTDHIFAAAVIIGVITFALSLLGCEIGLKIGHFFENRIEIIAGLVLIAIGVKILVQHLLAG